MSAAEGVLARGWTCRVTKCRYIHSDAYRQRDKPAVLLTLAEYERLKALDNPIAETWCSQHGEPCPE